MQQPMNFGPGAVPVQPLQNGHSFNPADQNIQNAYTQAHPSAAHNAHPNQPMAQSYAAYP